MTDVLKDGVIGGLAYSISVDGEVVEEVTADDPFEYLHGASNIVPGLEAALAGKEVGDVFDVTLAPEEAFGERDDDDILEVERDAFDEEGEPEVGDEVEMMDEDGDFLDGLIIDVRPNTIVVDLNHPLAGKTVRYAGTVVDIRDATAEELEWGWPESTLDEMFGEDEFDEDE